MENKQPLGLQTVIAIFRCLRKISIKAPYVVEKAPMRGVVTFKKCVSHSFQKLINSCVLEQEAATALTLKRFVFPELIDRYISVIGTRCVCFTHG